jgi:DNA-binding Lrp family transcriptional regulator
MYEIKTLDQKLLEELTHNGRATVAYLSDKLGVSRITVKTHMEKLEQKGVIEGYTIRWQSDYLRSQVAAHILIEVDQRLIAQVVRALEKIAVIQSLYSISGEFDLVAELRADSTESLDLAIDDMTRVEGVLRTHSSVLLSKKFDRK